MKNIVKTIYWIKSRNWDIIIEKNKQDSSPSLRTDHAFSKFEIFVEVFHANLQNLTGASLQNRHNFLHISGELRQKQGKREARVAREAKRAKK